jgi:zinc protease
MREHTDPLQLEAAEAASGLRIVRQPPPAGAASFSATLITPAGWGFDPAGGDGTARVASQLVTSGAGPRDRLELARYLDRMGATLSPQVDPESADITVWGPSDAWEALLGVLADATLRPRYSDRDLARVRRQLAETQMRELTQPGSRADRELLRAIFPPGHPYRGTGTGDPRSIARIGRSQIDRFQASHVCGAGVLLVVTGRPPLSRVVSTAGRLFSELPSGAPPRLQVPPVRAPGRREVRVDLPGRAQVEVRLGGRSIARADPLFPAAYLGNEVLGGDTLLGRLFRRVRSHGGLAYTALSHLSSMAFGGYWSARAGTGAARWKKVVPMLNEEVKRISAEPIPSIELNLIRESRIGEMALSLESTSDAHELAVDAAYYHLPLDHWKKWPAILRAQRPRDVQAATETAIDARAAVTVLTGPIGRG